MVKHLPVVLLGVAALAALVAAEQPARPAEEVAAPRSDAVGEAAAHAHAVARRGLRHFFKKTFRDAKHTARRVETKVKKVAKHVGADVRKLEGCVRRVPGLKRDAIHIVEACALSAAAGMPALGTCVALHGAIPAVRATSYMVVCMG